MDRFNVERNLLLKVQFR